MANYRIKNECSSYVEEVLFSSQPTISNRSQNNSFAQQIVGISSIYKGYPSDFRISSMSHIPITFIFMKIAWRDSHN